MSQVVEARPHESKLHQDTYAHLFEQASTPTSSATNSSEASDTCSAVSMSCQPTPEAGRNSDRSKT